MSRYRQFGHFSFSDHQITRAAPDRGPRRARFSRAGVVIRSTDDPTCPGLPWITRCHKSRPLLSVGRGSRPLFPTFGLVGVRLNLLGYIDEPCPYTVCHLSVL
jgi:hypothetical protein